MAKEPLGLRMLMETSHVKVKQEFSCFGQRLVVSTPEYGPFLTVKGVFKSKVKDTNNQEVMMLHTQTFSNKMEVNIGRGPAIFIKPKGGLSRSLWINDHNKQHVLKIKPSSGILKNADFKILGVNEELVGTIKRNWSSSYKVHYPQDLDVRYKGSLIAVCIYIEGSIQNES